MASGPVRVRYTTTPPTKRQSNDTTMELSPPAACRRPTGTTHTTYGGLRVHDRHQRDDDESDLDDGESAMTSVDGCRAGTDEGRGVSARASYRHRYRDRDRDRTGTGPVPLFSLRY